MTIHIGQRFSFVDSGAGQTGQLVTCGRIKFLPRLSPAQKLTPSGSRISTIDLNLIQKKVGNMTELTGMGKDYEQENSTGAKKNN